MSEKYYKIGYKDFNKILKTLLQEKMVDKVVSGKEKRNRFSISPILVDNVDDLDGFPLSQLFVYNFGRTSSASKFVHSKGGAMDEKIAMVGHPCDGRAIVELSKKLQVNLENVFMIILEDIGTIKGRNVRNLIKKEKFEENDVVGEFLASEKLILKLKDGSMKEFSLDKDIELNANCARCYRKKLDDDFDIAITPIVTEPFSDELLIRWGSERGKTAVERSNVKLNDLSAEELEKFKQLQETIIDTASNRREKELNEYLNNPDRIKDIAKCTMCGLCIRSCPVCFCKDCILMKQRKDKDIDKLSYQLTRVAHVGDACVGCGKCDQNCPPGLPLSFYFQTLNEYVKDTFDYVPGCDEMAPMPRSKEAVKDKA